MNQENLETLKRTRSMCLLYGIACFMAGLINLAFLDQEGLGMILVAIAVLGFWRISHKVKAIIRSEIVK